MNPRVGTVLLVCMLLLFSPAWADTGEDSGDLHLQEMKEVISVVSARLAEEFDTLDSLNGESARLLADTDLSQEAASLILNAKIEETSFGHSSLVITPEGRVTAAGPALYENLVGEDLSSQEIVRYANEVKEPVISDIFLLQEGFYGISFSHPITGIAGEYRGYTDITLKPAEFVRPIVIPVVEENGYDMMILQTDGVTIYDTDEEEIGRNVLDDPLYTDPEVSAAARAITSEPSGRIEYHFWNRNWDTILLRTAVWDTFSSRDQEWRIVVIHDRNPDAPVTPPETPAEPDQDLNSSIPSLAAFVDDAVSFARTEGREQALAAFNNLSGNFVSGDRYIFAYDMNGTTLALPYQTGLIGRNRTAMTDINGLEIMPALISLASGGGGNMYYVYPNPDAGYKPQLKLVTVAPVDEDWFIGSGLYLPDVRTTVDPDVLQQLRERVLDAVIHAGEAGKEAALEDFNNLSLKYADGGSYIFAYDTRGTTLALPHQPEYIGTSRLDLLDTYRSPIIRLEIDAAMRGGGYVYVVYYNPDTGADDLKLCYVSPAGDDWLVGSGVYLGQNLTGSRIT